MTDESAPIDGGAYMNIEDDYYNLLFNGRLCPGQNDLEGKKRRDYPFLHMWELFVYAAILGFRKGKNKRIEKNYRPFRWENIGNSHQRNLLILAVSQFGSFELLKDKDKIKSLIEEYANGGLSILVQEVRNNPSAFNGLEIFTYQEMND